MLRLALVAAAALRGAAAQYCPPGATTACDSVLILGSDDPSWLADVQNQLASTGAFARVDAYNTRSGTPTESELADYDAVLVYSGQNTFQDPALLGDVLAAYHDQGGGVVLAPFANADNNFASLRGAYASPANGYALLQYQDYTASPLTWDSRIPPADTLGEVLEPESPLLFGVASFSAIYPYRSTAAVIWDRGVVVARWRGDWQEPLVVRGARGNRTLVELNFFPPSGSVYPVGWTGSGAALMRNALKYSRCMPGPLSCGPGTFSAAGEPRQRGCTGC
jgi:hypothetical protein